MARKRGRQELGVSHIHSVSFSSDAASHADVIYMATSKRMTRCVALERWMPVALLQKAAVENEGEMLKGAATARSIYGCDMVFGAQLAELALDLRHIQRLQPFGPDEGVDVALHLGPDLVIGGTQFMGRHVVCSLRARGAHVTLLNRGKASNPLAAAYYI